MKNKYLLSLIFISCLFNVPAVHPAGTFTSALKYINRHPFITTLPITLWAVDKACNEPELGLGLKKVIQALATKNKDEQVTALKIEIITRMLAVWLFTSGLTYAATQLCLTAIDVHT